MEHTITHDPAFSLLQVNLKPNDVLVSEPGAMVAMSTSVAIEAKLTASTNGGMGDTIKALIAAAIRKFMGGESFFVTHYTSETGGSVWLAPTLSGSVVHHRLDGGSITLSSGAYVASSGPIEVLARYGGLRGLLAKEGLFFLEVSGNGDLWFNSYGGVDVIDVNGSYIVDTGHIVGWEGDLNMSIKNGGSGLVGMIASGEGLVAEFKGTGRVWIQSRNLPALVDWVSRLLPG